ncbi:helix-turn-helix transcriptional regulator [Cohnella lupini]|uniref:helix-turn-helix transcriptional regulator n=1 Tax=Cohnella lupini TaxID=1294267 RepID=UPI000E22B5BF|nr:PAS domain-containing protein [Cohnella lupini]
MSPDEILNSYKPMVEFIARINGNNCEVILHDLRQLENSIIAISNSHVTGRTVGGSITDFALSIIHDKKYEDRDFIANYTGKVANQERELRSSTYFIKDEGKTVIGMLCVNVDVTPLRKAREALDEMLSSDASIEEPGRAAQREAFVPSMEDLLRQSITEAIANYGIEPSRMLADEKKRIVGDLNAKGVFLLKGAVTETARRLETSEQTIYRYLKDF